MTESWLSVSPDSDFSIRNLPFGVVSPASSSQPSTSPRCATILGDTVIDLSILEEAQLFQDIPGLAANTFNQPTLNAFIEHPRAVWLAVRQRLLDLLIRNGPLDTLSKNENLQKAAFFPISAVQVHLPVTVGDYTDFYSSREHATNVGTMFRGKDNALQPNWLHLPVGYHGRSSTVVVSGRQFHRPAGQLQKAADDPKQGSVYGPCRLLDFELEVAAVVGGPANAHPLTLAQAKQRIFGFVLMNDWSARDIQKWEYVPLGPFTAKNFLTTISPWIVMEAALQDHVAPTSAGRQEQPTPLPYLQDPNYSSYDMALSVGIRPAKSSTTDAVTTTVCRSNFKNLYWNPAQQLVHHTVTGCVMQAGDLLGSGTISGQTADSFGSMLELSWKGSQEISVGQGQVRKFLRDGDTVVMTGYCQKPNQGRVGFGECTGTVLPALEESSAPVEEMAGPKQEAGRYQDFKLYSYWRSSSTWRVRVALAAKGVEYTTVPVNLFQNEHRNEDFLAKNPLGQVPLLEFTDVATGKVVHLSQSVAIIEFLDQIFPARRSMIPADPMLRAAALEMVELINAGTQPVQNIVMLREIEKQSGGTVSASEQAKLMNEKGLKALEVLVKRHRKVSSPHGPYCLGTFAPTIVDAVMVPQLYNARRFGVDVDSACPLLVEIESLCSEHLWFQVSHPSVQPDAPKE